MNKPRENTLQSLPAVHSVLDHPGVRPLLEEHGRAVVLEWVRVELDLVRSELSRSDGESVSRKEEPVSRDPAGERVTPTRNRDQLLDEIADRLAARAAAAEQTRIGRVINATGVILHTGLGRAALSPAAVSAISDAAGGTNVEIDLSSGERRYRGYQLQPAWRALTGCENSLIVNNNAAATLLVLQALCSGREVIISRGQLIEIGGSFRLPDIFELSGARLREVGTTNRTRPADYERALGAETAAVMHVHPSNYRVVGFTESPGAAELAGLAHARGLPLIDDVGSGSLVDVTQYGLPPEPTFADSIVAGADVVLGSGDKLLGGPQAGIILGRADLIKTIRRHPLARAVRVDKLTLAALSATLDAYLRGTADREIPTLAMLSAGLDDLLRRAHALQENVGESERLEVAVVEDVSPVGGGSLPGAELPTAVLSLRHAKLSADELARAMRTGSIRVFGRVQQERVLIDLRSVLPADDSKIALAVRLAAGHQRD